jgi:hypothetical protein
MRNAYMVIKVADTHSEYVILAAITRQQWLRERASMLRYNNNKTLLTTTASTAMEIYIIIESLCL